MNVPTHPQATADPQTLLWVVPGGLLPLGAMRRVPAPLQHLIDAGLLLPPEVDADGVRLSLPPGRAWRTEAKTVRPALIAALAEPAAWQPAVGLDADATLAAVATSVLDGETGAFVRSHGGLLRVAAVRDGVVYLDADGACTDCPALSLTLQARVGRAITQRLGRDTPVPVRLA